MNLYGEHPYRYAKILKPGLKFGRSNRDGGAYDVEEIVSLEDLGANGYTLKINVKNKSITLLKRLPKNAVPAPTPEPALPSIVLDLEEPEKEDVEGPTQEELDILWDSCQVSGTRKRYCPIDECGIVHGTKISLYNCNHILED